MNQTEVEEKVEESWREFIEDVFNNVKRTKESGYRLDKLLTMEV